MLIRELAYDTEEDQLDLLIDTIVPEVSEVVPIGDDIFLRRSIQSGKIVGAIVEHYSLWQPGRYMPKDVDPELAKIYSHIVQYLKVVKQKKVSVA
jgi:hypothetical protein